MKINERLNRKTTKKVNEMLKQIRGFKAGQPPELVKVSHEQAVAEALHRVTNQVSKQMPNKQAYQNRIVKLATSVFCGINYPRLDVVSGEDRCNHHGVPEGYTRVIAGGRVPEGVRTKTLLSIRKIVKAMKLAVS